MEAQSTSPLPSYLYSSRTTGGGGGQSTPDFSHADASSSPPNDILSTPRDSDKFPPTGSGRRGGGGRKTLDVARRSVRVRGASSSGNSQFQQVSIAAFQSSSPPHMTASSQGLLQRSNSRQRARLPPAVSRSSSNSQLATTSATSSTWLAAQAAGITPDQFEQRKQQVMRFLRTEAMPGSGLLTSVGSAGGARNLPTTKRNLPPSFESSIVLQQSRLGDPFVESSSSLGGVGKVRANTTTPITSLTPLLQYPCAPDGKSLLRSRTSSSELIAERNRKEEEERKGREVRKWAEDNDEDDVEVGEEEEEEELDEIDDDALDQDYQDRASSSKPSLHLQPSPRLLDSPWSVRTSTPKKDSPRGSSLTPGSVVLGATGSLARKGMMDAFMSAAEGIGGVEEESHSSDEDVVLVGGGEESEVELMREIKESELIVEEVLQREEEEEIVHDENSFPHPSQADLEAAIVLSSPISRVSRTPKSPVLAPITTSPPRRNLGFSPSAMMTSPAPSRSHPSIFDSPDVEKLLKKELKRMRSEEGSPRKRERAEDQVVRIFFILSFCGDADGVGIGKQVGETPFSSPYRAQSSYASERDSSYSSGGARRTRDVFTGEPESVTKRSRFLPSSTDAGPVSPTPSTSSLTLRAPSFCDSSPAVSERASTGGSSAGPHRPPYPFSSAQQQQHPASAPDYYNHLPSAASSPTSSHHSYSETKRPPTHRSSPGSSTNHLHSRAFPPASAPQADTHSRNRVAPMKRTNTSPAVLGPDGNYAKPSWSYAALIGQAIYSSEDCKISLADIYTFIMKSYPYYKKGDSGWQNSIRHNLSLNECFVKTARGADNPGKGCLWAIAPGCEEQFVDGGFTKKGVSGGSGSGSGSGSGRKGRLAAKAAPARFDPTVLLRPAGSVPHKRPRDSSPSPAVGFSPAKSLVAIARSNRPTLDTSPVRPALHFQDSPRPELDLQVGPSSPTPSPPPPQQRNPTPPPPRVILPPRQRASSVVQPQRAASPALAAPAPFPTTTSEAPVSRPSPALERQPSLNATSSSSANSRLTERRGSAASLSSLSSIDEPLVQKLSPTKLEPLAAPYVHRPASAPATIPAVTLPSRRLAATSPAVVASPPTSVYHRLAGPYQPISYSQSSAHNHRALALLASPEATGIMPVHPSVYDRAVSQATNQISDNHHSHFLPAPHIFPGSASRRGRDDEEDTEGSGQSMILPTSFVHTQSPVCVFLFPFMFRFTYQSIVLLDLVGQRWSKW